MAIRIRSRRILARRRAVAARVRVHVRGSVGSRVGVAVIHREYTWRDEVLDGAIAGLAVVCVLAIALGLIGCAPPPTPQPSKKPALPPIAVYTNATGLGLIGVTRGVDGWARVTRGVRDWVITPSIRANVLILEVPVSSGMCQSHMVACTYGTGGLWTHRNGDDPQRIFLQSGQYESQSALVTMHELGHKLGLGHVEGTIMARAIGDAVPSDPTCPDALTVARVSALLGERLEGCDE